MRWRLSELRGPGHASCPAQERVIREPRSHASRAGAQCPIDATEPKERTDEVVGFPFAAGEEDAHCRLGARAGRNSLRFGCWKPRSRWGHISPRRGCTAFPATGGVADAWASLRKLRAYVAFAETEIRAAAVKVADATMGFLSHRVFA